MIVTNTVNYPRWNISQINVGLATSTENGQPVNSVLSGYELSEIIDVLQILFRLK